jgi:hypothetical protein
MITLVSAPTTGTTYLERVAANTVSAKVGETGLEPATPGPPDQYSNHLSYSPKSGHGMPGYAWVTVAPRQPAGWPGAQTPTGAGSKPRSSSPAPRVIRSFSADATLLPLNRIEWTS